MTLKLLPECPISWHFVTYSVEIKKDFPFSFKLYGNEYIFFRDKNGALVATSPKCIHLGACFSTGKVKNGHLVCPFHAWEYDHSGKCVKIPSGDHIPRDAKLKTYPVYEKWGLVFFFNHENELFPFPFFETMDRERVVRSKCFEVFQEGIWYTVPSNAFDEAHFVHVHERIPLEPPQMSLVSKFQSKIMYKYSVNSKFWTDKILRFLFGNLVSLNFENWSGNVILATTTAGPFQNKMLIFIRPLTAESSVSQIFVFRNKKSNFIANFIQVIFCNFQAKASQSFFAKEARELKGANLQLGNFVTSDKNLVAYLRWLIEAHEIN